MSTHKPKLPVKQFVPARGDGETYWVHLQADGTIAAYISFDIDDHTREDAVSFVRDLVGSIATLVQEHDKFAVDTFEDCLVGLLME